MNSRAVQQQQQQQDKQQNITTSHLNEGNLHDDIV